MGYGLAEPYWGKGVAASAVNLVVECAFNIFDILSIFAHPFGTNQASPRALEKNGVVLEIRFKDTLMKNGIVLDELVYAIRKNGG